MEHKRIDGSTEQWIDERGKLEITSPRPGIVVERFEGYALLPMADAIIGRLGEEIARHGEIIVFDDWGDATGYESAVRLRLTEWTRAQGAQVRDTHIFVRSKLLAMGISVASMTLNKHLHSHASRSSFDAALAKALTAR